MMVYCLLMKILVMSRFFNETGILSVSLTNINLDNNFDEDPDTIILISQFTWHIKFEKSKNDKKIYVYN